MSTPANALNITSSGLVRFNGTATFSAVTVTNHNVLIGAASNGITSLALTNGQLAIGSTGADPSAANITSSDSSITISNGAGTISLQVAGGTTVGKTITGDSGGALSPTAGNWNLLGSGSITTSGSGSTLTTQLTGLTNHALLIGAGTSTITKLTLTNGQLAIGSTGADPSAATLTAGTGVSITNGAGSITINAIGGGLTWSTVTGTTQAGAVNSGYVANNAGLVTVTLPSTSAVGDVVAVTGINNATGWKIAQNAGNQIFLGTSSTTSGTGGSLASTATRDSVHLVCVTANAQWNVTSSIGNITVV